MKKILALGMLGLLVAMAFALGTSATFRDYRVQRSTHIAIVADDSELIDLTPAQPYAYINERGKLVIDFSSDNPNWPGHEDANWTNRGLGLSPQSRYNFDHVFKVSNDLWENKTILVEVISSDAGKVSFYDPGENMRVTGGNGTPYNSDTAAGDVCFYLAPGEELGVGMELAAPNTLGDYDLTITVMAWPADDAPFVCGGGI
ncbi:DUF1102 domain-containing protein [Thermococcus atlanticus]